TAVLTLGPNLTITGASGIIDSLGAVGIDNQGAIIADPAAQGLGLTSGTITVNGAGWTNHGAMGAQNGGTLTLNGSNWTNNGTINNNQSTINVGGSVTTAGLGTFTRTGGAINLTATLNNTAPGAVFRVGAAPLPGSWNLTSSATITGGSVAAATGSALVLADGNQPKVVNVQLDGTGAGNNVSPLDMQTNNSRLNVSGTLTLKGAVLPLGSKDPNINSFGILFFIDGTPQTIDGVAGNPGTIVFGFRSNSTLQANDGTAMTFGPNLTITGANGSINSQGVAFDNQGTIIADPTAQGLGLASGTITVTGTGWTNHGPVGA